MRAKERAIRRACCSYLVIAHEQPPIHFRRVYVFGGGLVGVKSADLGTTCMLHFPVRLGRALEF